MKVLKYWRFPSALWCTKICVKIVAYVLLGLQLQFFHLCLESSSFRSSVFIINQARQDPRRANVFLAEWFGRRQLGLTSSLSCSSSSFGITSLRLSGLGAIEAMIKIWFSAAAGEDENFFFFFASSTSTAARAGRKRRRRTGSRCSAVRASTRPRWVAARFWRVKELTSPSWARKAMFWQPSPDLIPAFLGRAD